jgi:hypothetical protein
MAQTRDPRPGRPAVYEIRLRGHLGQEWAEWFEGLAITPEGGGDTLLTGPVGDQAALFGLLKKVRNLGLFLISVNCVGSADGSSGERPATEEQRL